MYVCIPSMIVNINKAFFGSIEVLWSCLRAR